MRVYLAILATAVASVSAMETDPGPVNMNDRESARAWFNTWWPRSIGEPMGFTGNANTGVVGDISHAYREQVLLRINIFRRMAGVGPVTMEATANAKAQAAAVLCAANDDLSHNPPTTWKYYNALAAEGASKSQLVAWPGPTGVYTFFQDGGASNLAVPHRLALLEPHQSTIGIGSSEAANSAKFTPLGTMAILSGGGVSSTQLAPTTSILKWPVGRTPHFLLPGRWSASMGDVWSTATLDFSDASVLVSRNGQSMPVQFWRQTGGKGIVFSLDGTSEGNASFVSTRVGMEEFFSPERPIDDVDYKVVLTGIKLRATGELLGGTGRHEYGVTVYDPSSPSLQPGRTSQLINISTRSHAGTGDSTQIAGFILHGTENRKVLIRAAGPWLASFEVPEILQDPQLQLYEEGREILYNDDWSSNAEEVAAAAISAGAPAFERSSKDAALVATLRPGVMYTAHLTGKHGATGNALIEVYVADSNPNSRLVNISTRSFVGSGASIQIGGFILRGDGPRKVLIRAGGPWLSQFGVQQVLTDPVLRVFRGNDNIAENDDWLTSIDAVVAACKTIGLSSFTGGSKDSALVITVEPNVAYTAQVSGKDGGSGNALIEIYEVP